MPPTKPRFWVVGAGIEGEDEEQVLSSGLAMIGFREAHLPIPSDKIALREQLAAACPDWTEGTVGQTVGQLHCFAHVIKEGDFVVLPRKGAGPVAVGTITGPYEHREIAGELRHTRKVRWIRKQISRDKFSQDEQKFLNPGRTVFQISDNSVTDHIAGLLNEPVLDMTSEPGLRRACERAGGRINRDRIPEIVALLKKVQDASLEERATESFLIDVWTNDSVSDGGRCDKETLKSALQDDEFQHWFAQETTGDHASERGERIKRLSNIYNKTTNRLKEVITWRPKVETLRTLAVFFPSDFTGVANDAKLVALLQKMGGSGSTKNIVEANRKVLDRLHDVIGPLDNSDLNQVAERMLLTVELHKLKNPTDNDTDTDNQTREQPVYTKALDTAPNFRELTRRFNDNTKDLYFPEGLVEELHCGLWADRRRHFAILSGLSGSGKTKLAIEYAKALTGDYEPKPNRWRVTAVQPGWYDPGSLLGYVNPLDKDRYKRTDTCKLLLDANKKAAENEESIGEPDGHPYVLILDEMNLSHPEQYFAPLLSAMEQEKGQIPFHDGEEYNNDVPPSITYPANLVIIGTVNMDETTLGISDKVLDRAFTHEFWDIEPQEWWDANKNRLNESVWPAVEALLNALYDTLFKVHRHFGYRVIDEVVGFIKRYFDNRSDELPVLPILPQVLDAVIYAKVLPKLRGDATEQFRECLEDTKKVLNRLYLRNGNLEYYKKSESTTDKQSDEQVEEPKFIELKKCIKKVDDLLSQLDNTGSATFWR